MFVSCVYSVAAAAFIVLPSQPPAHACRRNAISPVLLNRKQRRHYLQPEGTPYPDSAPATCLTPTVLGLTVMGLKPVFARHASEHYQRSSLS